jgi:hypothetical protein
VLEVATAAGLGTDPVVQTAYGDSGKTTFFIDDESGWKRHRRDIRGNEVKVMRRINNRPVAVRDRLGSEGYRGFFEVDVLVDTDTDEVYLGELNPRISGASSITNVTAGAYADIPLFAFHLLEFFEVAFELDVDEISARWRELAAVDQWSQMVIKETSSIVQMITSAAPTGQYSYDRSGALIYRRAALDWHQLQNESEAFFLRIYGAGDYRWKGADLGVLVTKGRLQRRGEGGADTLTIRAKHLIDSIRGQYTGQPLAGAEAQAAPITAAPSMAK